ncbi:MAG: preprotein translocase subunit SecE [Clostridia bacterium]|nr:preprotein translocase subunit SecE [Clostridia bacterium]
MGKDNDVVKNSQKSDSVSKKNKPKSKAKEPNKVVSFFKKIGVFFRECKNEVKKIVWPTVGATFKNFGIVLSVVVIIGLFIFGLDTGLVALLEQFMSVAG